MSFPSRKKRNFPPTAVTDALPQALAHSAEEAASKVSGAAQGASARVGANLVTVPATARKKFSLLTRRRTPTDALLKAQLAKTSRELSREASDLRAAVDGLNAIIKANRKAAAGGRTRLIAGIGVGAAVVYHLDPESGRQRRAALVGRLRGAIASR